MFPIELPSSSGMRPLHFTILTFAMAILALVYVTYIGARWSGYWSDDIIWSDTSRHHSVRIGQTTFQVPLSLTPSSGSVFPLMSSSQVASSLNLQVAWPSMKGVPATAEGKSDSDVAAINRIFLNIATPDGDETMRDRLAPVYRRLARGPETDGPAGLKVLTLSSPIALDRDEIVFEPSRDTGFIARCKRPKGGAATCTRQLALNDELTITYRFNRSLLANWGRLDRRVTQLLRSLVR
ncbi:hypothetical protein [Roseibium sp.]|uniref:hypothetical protein n=1 Tax=Roseibium sp. TaxID=1936156 RepID=UPI003A986D60